MASMNVSVKVGTAAAVVLRQLKEMDVDQIRREGRCCEVLRSIREDAERFDQRFRNAPNHPLVARQRIVAANLAKREARQ